MKAEDLKSEDGGKISFLKQLILEGFIIVEFFILISITFYSIGIQTVKLLMILCSFFLEDSIQMFLEYFWIQKYVTLNTPTYLLIKDSIIAIIALYSLIASVMIFKKRSSTRPDYLFFGTGVVINLVEYLRVSAVLKLYKKGSFDRSCLQVVEGRLWQKPFAKECLTSVDKWILALIFVPFCALPFLMAAFEGDILKCKNSIKMKYSSQEAIISSNQNV